MVNAIRMDAPDKFFEEIGSVPVLLVDDFQDFFADEEAGPLLCKLMVTERDRLGLDTVFASDAPLSSFDLAAFEGALDGFEELAAEPLDEAGRRAFVLAMRDTFAEEGKAPALADDTVAYLAGVLGRPHRRAPCGAVPGHGCGSSRRTPRWIVETVKQALAS